MNGHKNSNPKVVPLRTVTDACRFCHARNLCMSSCLSDGDLQRFKDIVGHRAPMAKGERLFMAGEDIKSIFVLHSGSVKSYVESEDGDNQITGFYLPGDVIGIHGIDNKRHSDTVEALETSSVCELQFNNIEEICTAFPALHKQLMRFIFTEMEHDQEMMLVLGKMSSERRMAYFLLEISQRLRQHGLSDTHLHLSMTRNDIANHLGLAVETVSRILTRLQKAGVIEVDRKSIIIHERSHLKNIYHCSTVNIEDHDLPING